MVTALPADANTLRKFSTWFLIYGAVMIVLGLLAIAMPTIATLATGILLGWLLLAGGVFGLVSVFSSGTSSPGFWWNLLTAILYVLAGASLLWSPVAGALTLTIILAAYLFATGVTKLIMAVGFKNQIPGAWLWVLATAIIDIVLGLVIISGLPGTALWVLGLLVGINLLFTGVALVVSAVCCRSAKEAPPSTV